MADLPQPIVSPEELAPILDRVRVLDARSGPRAAEAYATSHLRGAVHVELDRDLAAPAPHPERGGRHPLPDRADFAARLGAWGITRGVAVVVYDDQGGANAAARVWWMLRSFGHENVSVLDGGFQAAIAAGLPADAAAPSVPSAPPYPASEWQWPVADIDEVDRARREPSRCVLDVRAAFRFRGESEPFDPVAGHIPGAANVPYAENLDVRGRFKSAAELRALYEKLLAGLAPADLVVHCGSGVTACHTLLALERAGLRGAALYVGSWSEWCRTDRDIGRTDDK